MGLAVDPGFASNRCIYACYMTATDVRVVRFSVGAGFSSLDEPDPAHHRPPARRRAAGTPAAAPRFGPDGMLWVTTGDAADRHEPAEPQLARRQGAAHPTPTARPGRQHGDGVRAADLRLRLPQPAGHHVPPATARRSSSSTARTATTRSRRSRAGGNGGWNPVPGYNESVPMTDLAAYPGALRPVWSSGYPTIAPSGGTFVTSDQWGTSPGATWRSPSSRTSSCGWSTSPTAQSSPIVTGQGRIRVAVEGPDGNLWRARPTPTPAASCW